MTSEDIGSYYVPDFIHITGVKLPNIVDANKTLRAIKGAPPQSLFSQFCLHCLWFGNCNIRGIYDSFANHILLLAFFNYKIIFFPPLLSGRD